jgi:hypothetical protein
MNMNTEEWPAFAQDGWADTCATLHMMTQVVGKVRLARAPMVNHWWQVTLYVTARGLTTSAMPYDNRTLQIDFDFIDHTVVIAVSDGSSHTIALRTRPLAHFYRDVMEALEAVGTPVRIIPRPAEVENGVPFADDFVHSAYEPQHAERAWHVLRQVDRALSEFRSRFLGKCSPVHFFWGGFDLCVTRFSGRRAPAHPGGIPGMADWVTREAYSHECSSVGFWFGSGPVAEPAFYSYTYPEPAGFSQYPVRPDGAYYSDGLREYILPYEAVRRAAEPDAMLQEFFQSTYEAGAVRGGWDRTALERPEEP